MERKIVENITDNHTVNILKQSRENAIKSAKTQALLTGFNSLKQNKNASWQLCMHSNFAQKKLLSHVAKHSKIISKKKPRKD